MPEQMHQIALASRPGRRAHCAKTSALESQHQCQTPGKGEVLDAKCNISPLIPICAAAWATINPMSASRSAVDGKMEGGGVGEVVASNVRCSSNPATLRYGPCWAGPPMPSLPARHPDETSIPPMRHRSPPALGVLGMPGFTGWHGLMEYGRPEKAGETLVVAAATGPVGSMVGQLAKSHGASRCGHCRRPRKMRTGRRYIRL